MRRMTNIEIVLTGPYPDLELQPENGYVPQAIDFGWPALRDNREVRTQQNGEDDYTRFFGARSVSVQVGIASELTVYTDQYLEDHLKKWMLPELESYLEFRRKGEVEWRRLRVKGTPFSRRLSLASFRFDHGTMSFRAPDGVMEHGQEDGQRLFTPQQLDLYPSIENENGRIYSATQLKYDGTGATGVGGTQKIYPVTQVIGAGIANNRGTAPAYPVVRIYGQAEAPRLINQDTGQQLKFIDGWILNSGEYVEIDFREGTVLLNGDPTNSRFDKVDFSVSEFFTLAPMHGTNLRYDPFDYDPPSHAEVTWLSTSL